MAAVPAALNEVWGEMSTLIGDIHEAMKFPGPSELMVASRSLGQHHRSWTWPASTTSRFDVIER